MKEKKHTHTHKHKQTSSLIMDYEFQLARSHKVYREWIKKKQY